MPSSVVRMKPLGSSGPGDRNRAMMPTLKPITMIQMMFDPTISCTHVFARVTRTSIQRAGDAA
jgi:hypothetical protein